MKAQLPATAAQRTCRAFTLLELLVSLAVLGLIILLVAQMLGPASAITGTGNKHIDTDTQARVILDRKEHQVDRRRTEGERPDRLL